MENKTKKYDFGEKKTENINGKECPVWQSPKYLEAKKKVIETLESEQYKNILSESDFWILVNTYANKTKAMYSGLIISHNGCLKINDSLKNKVNPNCFHIEKDGYNNSLVVSYVDDEICEFGEVSKDNCKNDYPYAMAYKRCFDRVVLKKCKLAYSGIYSDSEAEEFKERPDEQAENAKDKKAEKKKEEDYRKLLIAYCKEKNIDMNKVAKDYEMTGRKLSNDDYFDVLCDLGWSDK